MKLSKLYSNIDSFKNITFKLSGLNVIYADVITETSAKKNSHNLGKSRLAELIDYLLIKDIDKQSFLLKTKAEGESVFGKSIFFLEILLNSGKYLTIRRDLQKASKTSFSLNEQSSNNYIPPENWECEDIGTKAAREKLAEYLNFDFFRNKPYDYRKAINYCIRMQPDYDDVYKPSKYNRSRDIDWKPFMFDLLGFNSELLRKKDENDKSQKVITDQIKILKETLLKNTSRDEIVAEISLQERNIQAAEKQIDQLNFFDQDKELIEKGIDKIENSIASLNTLSYNLNFDIEKLRKSIRNNFAFDIDKINRIFQESNLYFPDNLKKEYSDLIRFNDELTLERNKLLRSTLEIKQEELKKINLDLHRLNKEKENLLSFLQETDTFKRMKQYQKELANFTSELTRLRDRLDVTEIIIEKSKKIDSLQKEIETTINDIKELSLQTDQNEKYQLIRTQFSIYFRHIMNEDAYISWDINSKNNVNFKRPIIKTKDRMSEDTAKDEGRTYRKILCVAFDLAILVIYNKESYFRFAYHDDVLSQQDNGIKNRLLDLVDQIMTEHDIQYIISAIKSDLPTNSEDDFIYFAPEDIVLELNDKDASGTLFGFEF